MRTVVAGAFIKGAVVWLGVSGPVARPLRLGDTVNKSAASFRVAKETGPARGEAGSEEQGPKADGTRAQAPGSRRPGPQPRPPARHGRPRTVPTPPPTRREADTGF